jgi:hypothetical protein
MIPVLPQRCVLFSMSVESPESSLFYSMWLMCSWYLTRKKRAISQINKFWQPRLASLCMPVRSYLLMLGILLTVDPILLAVLKATFRLYS